MPYHYYTDRLGEADGVSARFRDHLYFVHESGTILAMRSSLPSPSVGQNFYDAFLTNPAERADAQHYLTVYGQSCAFFRSENRTVILLPTFFSEIDCFVALVPDGDLIPFVNAAASLEGILPHARFSEEVKKYKVQPNEELFRVLYRYLTPYQLPLYGDPEIGYRIPKTLHDAISNRAGGIARLTGCHLEYDLFSLGQTVPRNPNMDLATGVFFLLFLTARRAAEKRNLTLSFDVFGMSQPLFVATMTLLDENDPLPELSFFPRLAGICGIYFDLERKGPELTVRWPLCRREKSVQSVKQPCICKALNPGLLPRGLWTEEETE